MALLGPLRKALLGCAAVVSSCASRGDESPTPGASGATAGSTSGGAPASGGESSGGESSGGESSGGESSGGADAGEAGQPSAGAPESGGEGGEGGEPTVKADCGSDNPAGCYRGMYVSPYTDHIGQVVFSGDDLGYAFILGDAVKEQKLLDFVTAQQIDSLSLYNLHVILADEALTDALESFMGRARDAGVLRIEGIAADGTATWDALHDYQQSRAGFDGFVTEIEFWAPAGDFDVFIDTLEYVRSLTWAPAPGGDAPTLSAYLGWPDAAQVNAMAPLLDRAYLHAYVSTAPATFGYVAERLAMFDDANRELGTSVAVWPIYSAEDDAWSAGAEYFMGAWLGQNGLPAGESAFMSDWAAAAPAELVLGGHQYYEYFFLDKYVD